MRENLQVQANAAGGKRAQGPAAGRDPISQSAKKAATKKAPAKKDAAKKKAVAKTRGDGKVSPGRKVAVLIQGRDPISGKKVSVLVKGRDPISN